MSGAICATGFPLCDAALAAAAAAAAFDAAANDAAMEAWANCAFMPMEGASAPGTKDPGAGPRRDGRSTVGRYQVIFENHSLSHELWE